MSSKRHKLCIILDETEHDDVEQQEEIETELHDTEAEPEIWQFDPGICG